MRESRAARQGLMAVVYRYHVPGPLPEPVMQEVRRGHVLRNKITEAYRQADEAVAGIYAGVPGVADAAAAKEKAEAQVSELRDQVNARKAAGRTRRPDAGLAAELKEARAALAVTREALREAKEHARDVVRPAVQAAAAEAEAKIRALYPAAGDGSLFAGDPVLGAGKEGALFWASWNMIRDQQKTAHDRVLDARSKRKPAELRFKRWDATGTVAVQLQRPLQAKSGGSAVVTLELTCEQDLTGVPVAWRVAGDGSAHVSVSTRCTLTQDTGRHEWEFTLVNEGDADAAVTCRADLSQLLAAAGPGAVPAAGDGDLGGDGTLTWAGTLKGGMPFRSRQVLADAAASPWRNVALLLPARPQDMPSKGPRQHAEPPDPGTLSEEEHAALPSHVTWPRAALRFRVGGGAAQELVTVPFRYHRVIPDGAEVTQVQVSCQRHGRRYSASLSVTVLLPAPPARTGSRVAAVHTGWRATDDGSLRVAVITGAAGAPPDICWRNERTGERQPGVIDHGTWAEVVIPPAARDLMDKARSLHGIRDRQMPAARQAVAAFLARSPGSRELVDPGGTLEQWKSQDRFRAALKAMAALDAGAPEVRALRSWSVHDMHLQDWAVGNETRFRRWRANLYATVGAWVTDQADAVVTDTWEAVRRKPAPEEEDTVQDVIARSNAVLASPGEIRQKVGNAARRRGVAVLDAPPGLAGVHHDCPASPPGQLPAEGRAAGMTVTCTACGRTVDQDVVMASAMAASAAAAAG